VRLDQYLAVSYFQQGVSNFLVGDFEEALANFNDTLLYLRGNTFIDYEQLGLKFKLYSCEALFNRGLCYIYLQERDAGMSDLVYASKEKATPDHDVIDEAIKEQAEGYTVFSIPVGVVYRPNSSKVKNLKTKDYLGKARLIASADKANTHTGFHGSEVKALAQAKRNEDGPKENISFAASNLVRTDLPSRSRQQSEPPINRNVFPPTPPPEEQQRRGIVSRAPSTDSKLSSRSNPVRPSTSAFRLSNRRQDTSKIISSVPEDSVVLPDPNMPLTQSPTTAETSPVSSPPSILKSQRPRLSPLRTASEPRYPQAKPSDGSSPISSRGGRDSEAHSAATEASKPSPLRPQRSRLFGETTGLDTTTSPGGHDADTEEGTDELNDLYRKKPAGNASAMPPSEPGPDRPAAQRRVERARSRQRAESRTRSQSRGARLPAPASVPPSVYQSGSDDGRSARSSLQDFEMLHNAGGVPSPLNHGHRRTASRPYAPTQRGFAAQPSHARSASSATGHARNASQASRGPDAPAGPAIPDMRTLPSAAAVAPHLISTGGGVRGSVGISAGSAADAQAGGVKTIRVKMHAGEETRYVMVGTNILFDEFERKVRDKLAYAGGVKVRVRDEGEFITVGDADDWELQVQIARDLARREGAEMGRLEVWVLEVVGGGRTSF